MEVFVAAYLVAVYRCSAEVILKLKNVIVSMCCQGNPQYILKHIYEHNTELQTTSDFRRSVPRNVWFSEKYLIIHEHHRVAILT